MPGIDRAVRISYFHILLHILHIYIVKLHCHNAVNMRFNGLHSFAWGISITTRSYMEYNLYFTIPLILLFDKSCWLYHIIMFCNIFIYVISINYINSEVLFPYNSCVVHILCDVIYLSNCLALQISTKFREYDLCFQIFTHFHVIHL